MTTKDKRTTLRIPLLSESIFIKNDKGEYIQMSISDITTDGCFIKDYTDCKVHDRLALRFVLPQDLGMLLLEGEVIRLNWADLKKENYLKGVGIKFTTNRTIESEKILGAYTIYLRNKQIITVSKRLIEEFFGNRPTP